MSRIKKIAYEILAAEEEYPLEKGWERVTIILKKDNYDNLKKITDIKSVFVKDVINDLIEIYNRVAITDKDKQNIEKEKQELQDEIKKLVEVETISEEKPKENAEKGDLKDGS